MLWRSRPLISLLEGEDRSRYGGVRGTNEMRLWVLPEEFTIVATKGFTDIDSQYDPPPRFTTSYRSGPGR